MKFRNLKRFITRTDNDDTPDEYNHCRPRFETVKCRHRLQINHIHMGLDVIIYDYCMEIYYRVQDYSYMFRIYWHCQHSRYQAGRTSISNGINLKYIPGFGNHLKWGYNECGSEDGSAFYHSYHPEFTKHYPVTPASIQLIKDACNTRWSNCPKVEN